MQREAIFDLLKNNFPFEPTSGQEELFHKMAHFLANADHDYLFMLKGYAGTGKTSFISALVKTLPAVDINFCLLAPTGRAAKVITGYSGSDAFTIHKKIYNIQIGRAHV